jgi:hypothetical protein
MPLPVKTGTATLAAGTVSVVDANITANSIIRVTPKTIGGVLGIPFISGKAAGAGFTIASSSGSDASVIYYEILAY